MADLVNYISDPLIGLTVDQQKAIAAKYWQNVTRENKVVGIPAQKEVYFLLYNQTWAKELGFDEAPKTFNEFSDQTKGALEANIILKDKTKPGTGGWLINWQPETALAWMGPEFVVPEDDQTFDQPILTNTFEGLKKIQLTNTIWLGINPDPIPYFVNRQALFISASSRELAEMMIQMNVLKMQDSWSIIAYPQFSTSGNHFTQGDAFGLLSDNREKQMAGWLFIQWMMSPDHQAYIGSHEYTIPVDQVAMTKLTDFSSETDIIHSLIDISADSDNFSSSPNWFITKPILADSFKQLFQPETTLDLIPDIITEMDRTYSEYSQ
jgi:ABC-type glycerol-3-phosphate transport system substrate-binding protein